MIMMCTTIDFFHHTFVLNRRQAHGHEILEFFHSFPTGKMIKLQSKWETYAFYSQKQTTYFHLRQRSPVQEQRIGGPDSLSW